MNKRKISIVFLLVLVYASNFAQLNIKVVTDKKHTIREITIDPAIGFHTNFGSDFLLSTLVQWNPLKNLSLASGLPGAKQTGRQHPRIVHHQQITRYKVRR